MNGPIRKITCARGCGYVRPYHDNIEYLSRVIVHPLYGPINGQQLVEKDMWFHDCGWHIERRNRAREVTGYSGRVYSAS